MAHSARLSLTQSLEGFELKLDVAPDAVTHDRSEHDRPEPLRCRRAHEAALGEMGGTAAVAEDVQHLGGSRHRTPITSMETESPGDPALTVGSQ
jgi:hypothetical protein